MTTTLSIRRTIKHKHIHTQCNSVSNVLFTFNKERAMNTITVESIHDVSVDRITSPLCNRVNPLGKSGVPLPNVIQKRIVDFLRNKEAQGISLTVTYGDSDAVWERFKIDINFSVSNILNNEVEQMKKKIKNDLYHQLFTVMDLFPIHSTHNYYIQEQDEVIE